MPHMVLYHSGIVKQQKKYSLMFIYCIFLLVTQKRVSSQLLISITVCVTPSTSDRIVSLFETSRKISFYPERLEGGPG